MLSWSKLCFGVGASFVMPSQVQTVQHHVTPLVKISTCFLRVHSMLMIEWLCTDDVLLLMEAVEQYCVSWTATRAWRRTPPLCRIRRYISRYDDCSYGNIGCCHRAFASTCSFKAAVYEALFYSFFVTQIKMIAYIKSKQKRLLNYQIFLDFWS